LLYSIFMHLIHLDDRQKRILEYGCVGAIFILYLLIKARTLHYLTTGDENIWYYSAYLLSEGVLPYRDFFHSHPPLQILLASFVIFITNFSLPALNALPVIASAISGLCVYLLMRREYGFYTAFIACALFLFSLRNLMSSMHYTSVNLTVMFMLLGLLVFQKRIIFTSGIVFGVGTAAGIPVAITAVFLFLLSLLRKNWDGAKRLVGGCLVGFFVVCGYFLLISGGDFFRQLIHYRVLIEGEAKSAYALPFLAQHQFLAVGTGLFVLVMFFRLIMSSTFRRSHMFSITIFSLLVLYALFIVSLGYTFAHYFFFVVPFMVMATASIIHDFVEFCSHHVPEKGVKQVQWIVMIIIIGAVFITSLQSIVMYAAVRESSDGNFLAAYDIASYVQTHLAANKTLYGDFGIAPLIAILADRRIAGNEVESSVMRFENGFDDFDDLISAIEADNVGAMIVAPDGMLRSFVPFTTYLLEQYQIEHVFKDSGGTTVEFWLHT
jgi:hypothetical protein